ncbi:galactose oxidase [Alteromonas pelagimontana]|uniref:Galactose oxidase n=1 Tax=Alteromonas pelagimontana TaxID=1858656 RepID=A0A6M4MKA3_9ALTE|nr:kelch repeat-containing protein [Alteromonas pelagimontana]QJR82506.1 galactose oxidase [Alteromonas pelagimontana]
MVKWLVAGLWLTGTFASAIAAEPVTNYRWSLGPSLPQPVQEIYPAVLHNAIYVAGGLRATETGGLNVSAHVYRLQKDQEKWQRLAPLPAPRHHPMLVAVKDNIWSFGGFVESDDGQWTNTNSVLMYDENVNEWAEKTPMPVALSETVSGILNGKIHIAGGRTPKKGSNGKWADQEDANWHGVFDPEAGVWQTAAPMPTSRNSACAVVAKGKWHVIGGRTVEEGNLDSHEIFDPATNEWVEGKPLPQPQAGLACAVLHGNIFAFGGEYFTEGRGVFSSVWRYNLKREKWSQATVMPVPRHGLGAVSVDDAIWIIGGAAKAGANDTRSTVSKLKLHQ